jgi:flagellar biogenesis protein FliO
MFWYFLLSIAAGIVLFLFGSLSVQVSILTSFFKIAILVAFIAALIYVYKKLSSRRKSRLLPRSGDG